MPVVSDIVWVMLLPLRATALSVLGAVDRGGCPKVEGSGGVVRVVLGSPVGAAASRGRAEG